MRGLSPVVSALILIAAAVIGGILAYQYFLGTISAMVTKPNIAVEDATLYTGLGILYVRVSNMGSSTVKLVSAEILCGSTLAENITLDAEVKPGRSVSLQVPVSQALSCDTPYLVVRYDAPGHGVQATRPIEIVVIG